MVPHVYFINFETCRALGETCMFLILKIMLHLTTQRIAFLIFLVLKHATPQDATHLFFKYN